jgi:hypothetical protein
MFDGSGRTAAMKTSLTSPRPALTRLTEAQFIRGYSAFERMTIANDVARSVDADFESLIVTEALHAMADSGETDMARFFDLVLAGQA